jgi:hypothetical protein
MSGERPLSLQRFDNELLELATAIEGNLDLVKSQVKQLAGLTANEDSGVPASGDDHYREAVSKLRSVARDCGLPDGAQNELLVLARRYERRANHLDRRLRSKTSAFHKNT